MKMIFLAGLTVSWILAGGVAAQEAEPYEGEALRALAVRIEEQVLSIRGLPGERITPGSGAAEQGRVQAGSDRRGSDPGPRVLAWRVLGLLPKNHPIREDPMELPWCGADRSLDHSSGRLDRAPTEDTLSFHVRCVHAVVHALQNRRRGLGSWKASAEKDDDRHLALQAVVEGEARLVARLYAAKNRDALAAAAVEDGMNLETLKPPSEALADRGLPQMVVDVRAFPAVAGERFVGGVYRREGWKGVDRLFECPPASTEQILHPNRYRSGGDPPHRIALVPLSGGAAPEWEMVFENTLGEVGVSCLARELGDAMPALRVGDGWGGDRYALYRHKERVAFALYLASSWDSGKEAWQFFDAMEKGLAFLVQAKGTRLSGTLDTILLEGVEGSALLALKEDRVLILLGFSRKGEELERIASAAWGFTVDR